MLVGMPCEPCALACAQHLCMIGMQVAAAARQLSQGLLRAITQPRVHKRLQPSLLCALSPTHGASQS